LNLLVMNLVKCPPRYSKMISGGFQGHLEFVQAVAEDFQKSGRTGLEKVPEDLISDDEFSRMSQASTELLSMSDMAKVLEPRDSNSLLTFDMPISSLPMKSQPPPPSRTIEMKSVPKTSSKPSASTSSLHMEEEEDEEDEEEELEEGG